MNEALCGICGSRFDIRFDHVCNGFLGVGSGGIQETEITVLIQIRDTLQQILEKMK